MSAAAALALFLAAAPAELRVCADPNNLPFSNRRGEGFENRIADLFAKRLSGAGELFPLRLDIAANLLERPVVATGHCASTPQS